jgi:hypothetical protein
LLRVQVMEIQMMSDEDGGRRGKKNPEDDLF